jgi:hypothetical protein
MTHAYQNELARAAAIDFARCLISQWRKALGNQLLGAYMIGSVAHGGFSRRYSDIDIALTTLAELSPQAYARLRSEAVALCADFGAKVSIFWADRDFSIGRFPPLDRVDYLDHAIVLMEHECVSPGRPGRSEIRQYLRGEPFSTWADQARCFAGAHKLEPKDHKAYLRTLLYPARFCFSWMTGRVGSNDNAVAFMSERPSVRLDVDLMTCALKCRQVAGDPDHLFSARTALLSQVEACASLMT